MILDVAELRALAEDVLAAHGAPLAHARIQTDLLLEGELRGLPSHGLLRLRRVIERIDRGLANPATQGRQQWLHRNFLDVDGEQGLGPVVANAALAAIEPRAREDGIAIAAIRNSNHIAMLAWYAEQVARRGLILVAMTTSEALVHPWGGRKKMLGTNPLAIAVPAAPEPLVLDMATGLVSMGKIHDYANRGEQIPAGWALDEDGNPTTDPVAAKRGAIAPFGGPKGYALGLALEVLVTALAGSAIGSEVKGTLDSEAVCTKGDVFIMIAPRGGAAISQAISQYLDEIRACIPLDPAEPVSVPGDRARHHRAESLKHGLHIDDRLWRDLLDLKAATANKKAMA
jgi:LDH2 family malate/lactate/ureidoglycolate dehydrogenase